jgi:glycosyltransferase involved in cell wall biosynthesis
MQKFKISVVIPIFDAELTLENLIKNILAMVKPFASSCEIILIDDFSSDNSWNIIKSLSKLMEFLSSKKFTPLFILNPCTCTQYLNKKDLIQ